MTSVVSRRMASALVAVLGVALLGAGCDAGYSVDQSEGADASPLKDGASSTTTDGGSDANPTPKDAAVVDASTALDLGTGADGAFTAMVSNLNYTCFQRMFGTAGSTTLASSGPGKLDANKLPPGTVLFIHQTQGVGAGNYELATIQSVSAQKAVVLAKPLAHTYAEPGAQAIVVRQYTDFTIGMAQTVDVPAWDGQCGGILPFRATGTVSIAGALQVSGHGFRSNTHGCVAGGPPYECNQVTPDTGSANGFAGESEVGAYVQLNTAHGSGGGGGMDGSDCGMGGGGSHATAGTPGPNGGGQLPCRTTKQSGGAAGLVSGVADLSQSLLFGGAGGEGGADEDGASPGPGGNGGGIIFIAAKQILVSGTIAADGAVGGAGVASGACGGTGTGMGGGGGGAGGSIRLAGYAVDVSLGKVSARGGTGGACGGASTSVGGVGGAGRIGVLSPSTTGSTTPAFDPN